MYWNASGSSVDGGRGRRARNFRRREYLLIVELVVGLIIRRAGGKGGGEVRMMHNNGSEVCKGQGRGGGTQNKRVITRGRRRFAYLFASDRMETRIPKEVELE